MTKEYDQIRDLDAEVVAISTDDLSKAQVMAERVGIPFPVLYDPDADVVRDYEVYNLRRDGLVSRRSRVLQGILVNLLSRPAR